MSWTWSLNHLNINTVAQFWRVRSCTNDQRRPELIMSSKSHLRHAIPTPSILYLTGMVRSMYHQLPWSTWSLATKWTRYPVRASLSSIGHSVCRYQIIIRVLLKSTYKPCWWPTVLFLGLWFRSITRSHHALLAAPCTMNGRLRSKIWRCGPFSLFIKILSLRPSRRSWKRFGRGSEIPKA